VKASRHFTRPFEVDKQILQRETKKGVPGVLKVIAPLVVLAIALGLLTLLAGGLGRVGRDEGRTDPPSRTGVRGAGRPQTA
jgi:hypothetical protein